VAACLGGGPCAAVPASAELLRHVLAEPSRCLPRARPGEGRRTRTTEGRAGSGGGLLLPAWWWTVGLMGERIRLGLECVYMGLGYIYS